MALTDLEGRDSVPKLLFHVNSTIIFAQMHMRRFAGKLIYWNWDLSKTKVPNDIYPRQEGRWNESKQDWATDLCLSQVDF